MKRFKVDPKSFDGAKFAKRYSLKNDPRTGEFDFWMQMEKNQYFLYVKRDDLVPDQPVFEPSDSPKPRVRITWQESEELEPRMEERELKSALSDAAFKALQTKLKKMGALYVEKC